MSILRLPLRARHLVAAMGVAVLASSISGCNDFLTSTKYRTDPSGPKSAGADNLFIAIQLNTAARMTDYIAQSVCIWMQQCAGVQSPYLSVGQYAVGNDSYYGSWADFYGGGGLLDLHTLEALTVQRGDSIYTGQAYVLEALLMGTLADIWGDIPYSQAANRAKFPHPALDSQQAVYDSLEKKLASAIVLLGATGPTNFGALSNDASYGGDPTRWAALASSLRARYFLHMAKKLGAPAYDSALAATLTGIASDGGNFVSANLPAVTQSNLWYQLLTVYTQTVVAGSAFVDTLANESDPRLALYFDPNGGGQFVGADPGEANGDFSQLDTIVRIKQGFQQPIVTFEENQLIQAEAALQTGQPGIALTALNTERAAQGVSALGAATLHNIIIEKYTALFQNIEIWSDWRRTNIPSLTPFSGGTIPRRIVYQDEEVAANPSIPGPGPQRNWNDP
jgi:starch-binding outer membrane protein, SusD/RagB family